MKTLRLILGDQLNAGHSWFSEVSHEVTYLMAEMRQETDYARHHIQKVLAFFASMRGFAAGLEARGHRVRYFRLGDPDNPQRLQELVALALAETGADRFEYQLPDEYRLDRQLQELCQGLPVTTGVADTEHFFTHRGELADHFKGKKQLLMESFYRMMRRKHGVLMQGDQPEGGQWNFDRENRRSWSGSPPVPPLPETTQDLSGLEREIRHAGVQTIGRVNAAAFPWPTSREAALALLAHFCRHLLPYFGAYQDAMHPEEPFLFHSRLSFALNSKILSPAEVVRAVESEYRRRPGDIGLSQAEGFIRQVLGWREYMRGVYWKAMPAYASLNHLENHRPLPAFYWTGETHMNCLRHAIGQSLDHAYAHHIQRLMVTGNFALLAGVHPDQVDAWYLGIYIDALEWVEITNTRGMSQYADGGLLSTKPYISSANYIKKMGNYCQGCRYDPGQTLGETACPFNALYWHFLEEKRPWLASNPRMGMMYNLLGKKDAGLREAISRRAAAILENPDRY